MAIERDCNTCRFHAQGWDGVPPFVCISCIEDEALPKWQPALESYVAAIDERHAVRSEVLCVLTEDGGAPTQSRKESLIETTLNVFSGWLISLLLWMYVIAPAFGIQSTLEESAVLNGIFTVISIVRGYFWRRFFANKLWRKG